MADSLKVDVGSLADYAAKYKPTIMQQYVNSMDVKNDVAFYPDVTTNMRLTNIGVDDDIVQPYSSTFGSTDDQIGFTARDLTMSKGKIDVTIKPEELRQSYLSVINTPNAGPGQNLADLPFEAFIFSEIMKKGGALVNDHVAYFGDSTSTTATPLARRIGSGYKKLLAAAIAAAEVPAGQVVTGGALTSANALIPAEMVWKALPESLQNVQTEAFVSRATFTKIVEELRTANKYVIPQGDYSHTGIDLPIAGGMCKIKPRTWMNGSNRIIITPKENLIMGADSISGDLFKIDIVKPHPRVIEVGIDFAVGFQIHNPKYLACNELL